MAEFKFVLFTDEQFHTLITGLLAEMDNIAALYHHNYPPMVEQLLKDIQELFERMIAILEMEEMAKAAASKCQCNPKCSGPEDKDKDGDGGPPNPLNVSSQK